MGSTSRTGRAVINPTAPSALGICDRCGFQYNLRDLRHQYDWCGTRMQNLQIKVCATCYDRPQEQKRTIILPPDPLPVSGPRTEPFFLDEINHLTLRAPIGKTPWLRGVGSIETVLLAEPSSQLGGSIGGASGMIVDLAHGQVLAVDVSGTGNVTADVMAAGAGELEAAITDSGAVTVALLVDRLIAALIGTTGAVTADLLLTPAGGDSLLQENLDLLLLEDLSPIVIDQWQGDVSAASALTGTEQIAVVQGGVTERTTIADVVTKLRGY